MYKTGITFMMLVMLFITACGEVGKSDAELEQAASAIKTMIRPNNLARSSFSVTQNEGKPSEYISFFFSTLGSAEWPVAMDPMEEEQFKSIRQPTIPHTVHVIAHEPDPAKAGTKQLVLRADDARGVLIVDGYVDPLGTAIFSREWVFKR